MNKEEISKGEFTLKNLKTREMFANMTVDKAAEIILSK